MLPRGASSCSGPIRLLSSAEEDARLPGLARQVLQVLARAPKATARPGLPVHQLLGTKFIDESGMTDRPLWTVEAMAVHLIRQPVALLLLPALCNFIARADEVIE
jgi:hypothetical protein